MNSKAIVMVGAAWAGAWLTAPAASPALPAQSVHLKLWPSTTHDVSGMAAADRFALDLMAHMTLEDKIGQMIQADIASISPQDLQHYKLGAILAGGNAAPDNDVRSPPQAWLDLTDAYYRASVAQTGAAHAPIPILFGIDAVHGHAKVRGATIFPHNIALGAAHDPKLIRRIGAATAAEVASTGVDWTFAPTVAVVRDVRWGRSYESYSELPGLVAEYAPEMVTGLQGERGTPQFMSPGHTLSSVKHFLGDGGTLAGRDQGDTVATEGELSRIHGAGYGPAIDAGALIVMASYNSWNGVKMHADHYLLTDVLKGRMGFAGFVVGDWDAQEQVPGCTKSSCPTAVLAGIDMLMAPDGWKELYENMLAQARSGEIPAARIDDAVRRILRVKFMAGIFSRPAPKERSDAGHFEVLGSPSHRAIARAAVRESLVLLKNAHATLPLDPHAHVLVAGAAADDIGVQCGGWTLDWQGDHNTNADFPGATSIYGGIRAAVTQAGGSATFSPDGSFTRRPDVAIVVYGEAPYAEFQGDRETLQFSPRDQTYLTMLRRLHAAGIPTVSVFLSGRPLWVNPELNASDAFVAAWLPGSEGEGIADVLFRAADGKVAFDFTGRLSFAWPATAMPVTFDPAGRAHGALYGDGFGLDYHHAVPAGPTLAEEPHIPPQFDAPLGSLFFAGHATAPWTMFVADGDAEVHVATRRQASPHGAVSVSLDPVGAAVSWNGRQGGMLTVSGRASDMRARADEGASLHIRYRIDVPPNGPVSIGMRCSADPLCGSAQGAMLDVTETFATAPRGVWQTLAIPLSCWRQFPGVRSVYAPFAVATPGKFAMTIADIRVVPGDPGAVAQCPAPKDTPH